MGSGASKSSGDNTTKCLEDYSPEELASGISTRTDIVERVKKFGLDGAYLANCNEQDYISTLQHLEITHPLTIRIISSKLDQVPRAGSTISFLDIARRLDDGTARRLDASTAEAAAAAAPAASATAGAAASTATKENGWFDTAKKEQQFVETTKSNQHCIDYINEVCRDEFNGKFPNDLNKCEFLVRYLHNFGVELKDDVSPGMAKSKTAYKLVDGEVPSHVLGPKSFYRVYEKQKAAWSSNVDTCSTKGSHRNPTPRSESTNDASSDAADVDGGHRDPTLRSTSTNNASATADGGHRDPSLRSTSTNDASGAADGGHRDPSLRSTSTNDAFDASNNNNENDVMTAGGGVDMSSRRASTYDELNNNNDDKVSMAGGGVDTLSGRAEGPGSGVGINVNQSEDTSSRRTQDSGDSSNVNQAEDTSSRHAQGEGSDAGDVQRVFDDTSSGQAQASGISEVQQVVQQGVDDTSRRHPQGEASDFGNAQQVVQQVVADTSSRQVQARDVSSFQGSNVQQVDIDDDDRDFAHDGPPKLSEWCTDVPMNLRKIYNSSTYQQVIPNGLRVVQLGLKLEKDDFVDSKQGPDVQGNGPGYYKPSHDVTIYGLSAIYKKKGEASDAKANEVESRVLKAIDEQTSWNSKYKERGADEPTDRVFMEPSSMASKATEPQASHWDWNWHEELGDRCISCPENLDPADYPLSILIPTTGAGSYIQVWTIQKQLEEGEKQYGHIIHIKHGEAVMVDCMCLHGGNLGGPGPGSTYPRVHFYCQDPRHTPDHKGPFHHNKNYLHYPELDVYKSSLKQVTPPDALELTFEQERELLEAIVDYHKNTRAMPDCEYLVVVGATKKKRTNALKIHIHAYLGANNILFDKKAKRAPLARLAYDTMRQESTDKMVENRKRKRPGDEL